MTIRTKQEVLDDVGQLVRGGNLSLAELTDAYNRNTLAPGSNAAQPVAPAVPATPAKARALSLALYIVGTIIVCLSICLLIGQNWREMSPLTRILSTFGLGMLVMIAAGARARRFTDSNQDFLANSLFSIAGVGTVIGAGEILYEITNQINVAAQVTLVALLLTAAFAGLYRWLARNLVLALFAIIMALTTYYVAIQWSGIAYDNPFGKYVYPLATIVAGLLVGAGGWWLRARTVLHKLTPVLYELAAFMVLGAGYILTFTTAIANKSLLFDVLYPLLLAAGVWASVRLASRGILMLTAFFLTCFIFELSWEYFSGFLGGSFALLLAGVVVIGTAYGATRFAKRFIR